MLSLHNWTNSVSIRIPRALHVNSWIFDAGQDFRRVGLSTLTDILNVVAPPISEHEVIQVWLSHDMKGYEGVETLVYRALARVCVNHVGSTTIISNFIIFVSDHGAS